MRMLSHIVLSPSMSCLHLCTSISCLHAEAEPQVFKKVSAFFRVESEMPWLAPYFDNPVVLF